MNQQFAPTTQPWVTVTSPGVSATPHPHAQGVNWVIYDETEGVSQHMNVPHSPAVSSHTPQLPATNQMVLYLSSPRPTVAPQVSVTRPIAQPPVHQAPVPPFMTPQPPSAVQSMIPQYQWTMAAQLVEQKVSAQAPVR
jgi:hypothetical protein